jgi:probable F420-dependent oxidoreductase
MTGAGSLIGRRSGGEPLPGVVPTRFAFWPVVNVMAEPRNLDSWLSLARRSESAGFEALLVGDHPGSGASPWPALGAAAATTSTLKLGTYVLQAGVRDPIQVAGDAATLDILAPGRVLLGLGAGPTFAEWETRGAQRPSPAGRAGRLEEFVDAVAGLLDGQAVTINGQYLQLVDVRLDGLPTGRVQLVVGGGHPRVLRVAAARAQIVALSGLGRTHPDGHRHDARWSTAELHHQLGIIGNATAGRAESLDLEALVQVVTVTDDRDLALAELAIQFPEVSVQDAGSTPYLLIGTIPEMVDQLKRQSRYFGITRYVVREPAFDSAAQILALLNRL